jgi:probable F420-dependent oxidoreductase
MPTGLKVGLTLQAVNPKFWVAASQEAEQAGFESVWVPEHLVLPVKMSGSPHTGHATPPIPPSMPAYDVWVSLAMVAASTSTIRLGTHVYNIGLRHPFVTARAVATLDVFSGGRVDFGIGASWLEEEWDAMQLDFASRGRRVDEAIEICQRLWSEDVVEYHGEFFDFDPVMFNPKPIQQPIPIIVGGDSRAALRRTANIGAGWIPMNTPVDVLRPQVDRVNEMRAAAGRSGATEVTIGGGGAMSVDDFQRYRDAGVDRILCAPFTSSREALEGIRRFGDEVIAKLD